MAHVLILTILLHVLLSLFTVADYGNDYFLQKDELRPWYHPHKRRYVQNVDELTTQFHDAIPFLFTNKLTNTQAIFCLHPKAGSTNFKYLLRYANYNFTDNVPDMPLHELLNSDPHGLSGPPSSRVMDFEKALTSSKVPRIMIVRNPYIRLLSGFLDKILGGKLDYGPPDYQSGESFDIFVKKEIQFMRTSFKYDEIYWDHFRLMTSNCMTRSSMTYDYYLPLEQLQYWYEPLIRELDLIPFVQLGWNVTTYTYFGQNECFYTTPHRKCTDMFKGMEKRYAPGYYETFSRRMRTGTRRRQNKAQEETSSEQLPHLHCPPVDVEKAIEQHGKQNNTTLQTLTNCTPQQQQQQQQPQKTVIPVDRKSHHATGSVKDLAKYYHPDLIDLVTEWVMPDLLEYHYPIWYSNMTAEEYLREVYTFPYPFYDFHTPPDDDSIDLEKLQK